MSLWLPLSACDTGCLPAAGTVPRVAPGRFVARLAAVVAVLAVAAAVAPLTMALSGARRARAVRTFARTLLSALGVRHTRYGKVPDRAALVVANHVSWLDILVLLAHSPARPLAKREVEGWPMINRLAAATGTVFIDRTRPRALPGTVAEVADALRAGHPVLVFPEGTTWCGRAGGRFRPALFQAAIDAGAPVVPVTVGFHISGSGTTLAAFLGADTLFASVRRVLAASDLYVTVRVHAALHPTAGGDRRALARAAQAAVFTR